jgi:carbamoyltransferase
MYLGGAYTNEQIANFLKKSSLDYEYLDDPYSECAADIADGKVIGWLNGRSEFGPRALGARSILANPLKLGMKDTLNAKIKFRESYRPFAPAILRENLEKFVSCNADLSSMVMTIDAPKSLVNKIPEAVHFDGTTRVQSVRPSKNKNGFYDLLKQVEKRMGFGAVINTSFNLAGEPIVDTPADAVRTFYTSGIDVLYLENIKLKKNGFK